MFVVLVSLFINLVISLFVYLFILIFINFYYYIFFTLLTTGTPWPTPWPTPGFVPTRFIQHCKSYTYKLLQYCNIWVSICVGIIFQLMMQVRVRETLDDLYYQYSLSQAMLKLCSKCEGTLILVSIM